MALTDLTGTTWVFNDTIDISSFNDSGTSKPFNFTSNGNSYIGMSTDLKPNGLHYLTGDFLGDSAYVSSTNSWTDSAYKNITITGGADATNPNLINWLQANATLQETPTTDTKPVYKRVNGKWIKQDAFQRVSGAWVRISSKEEVTPEEYTDCITFTGESSEFTLAVGGTKDWNGTVEYSTDHNIWTVWDGTAVSSVNKKLYLRGSGNIKFRTRNGARFVLSARAACSGNIQTLLEYNNPPTSIPSSECYRNMFYNCINLTQAPELPATTLTDSCYNSMFYNCTNLITAPALPATTLVNYCYYNMFRDCTSLTQVPELPATDLASNCCYNMFRGCISLTQVPELPATTLASNCYYYMFSDCTSLTQAPKLPATTLAESCYDSMFYNCTSLTKAPELPATTLAKNCYYNMLRGCTSLKISTTQSSEYPTVWRIPSSGMISTEPTSWNYTMLYNTGGTFTSNPSINTTYYGAWTK